MATGIKEMMAVDTYLMNVIEEVRGQEVERTYLAIHGEEGQKPLLLVRFDAETLVAGPPSHKLKEEFIRKLSGRELPKLGQANESEEIDEGETDSI